MAGSASKFFRGRRHLELDLEEDDVGRLLEYQNLPASIGAVVSSRLATLVELQTVLGLEDVYNLLEVLAVDAHNRRLMAKRQTEK